MNKNVYDVLKERGFLEQSTDEQGVRELLSTPGCVFYMGIDATADSLTVGHFLAIMATIHLQRAGHIPIILFGGATTLIGDPSGRNDMRAMSTIEKINHNIECFTKQVSKYVDLSDGKAIVENNIDWFKDLNYIEFMREIALHFNVKHMLQAECYKNRVDNGLTLFEFNYMLMQSYDFYVLNKKYGCKLEVGGNDQWSNIIGGVDLVRLKKKEKVYGQTFKLLTKSDGQKMGKSAGGAIWLDPEKTSPFDFFQYWRNVEDIKVRETMLLLTFLPIEEIDELTNVEGSQINKAKEVLAYEITKLVHGQEEADKVLAAVKAVYESGGVALTAPTFEIDSSRLNAGVEISEILVESKLESSKSEAKRSIKQGAVSLDNEKVTDIFAKLTIDKFKNNGTILLRKGKKKLCQLKLR